MDFGLSKRVKHVLHTRVPCTFAKLGEQHYLTIMTDLDYNVLYMTSQCMDSAGREALEGVGIKGTCYSALWDLELYWDNSSSDGFSHENEMLYEMIRNIRGHIFDARQDRSMTRVFPDPRERIPRSTMLFKKADFYREVAIMHSHNKCFHVTQYGGGIWELCLRSYAGAKTVNLATKTNNGAWISGESEENLQKVAHYFHDLPFRQTDNYCAVCNKFFARKAKHLKGSKHTEAFVQSVQKAVRVLNRVDSLGLTHVKQALPKLRRKNSPAFADMFAFVQQLLASHYCAGGVEHQNIQAVQHHLRMGFRGAAIDILRGTGWFSYEEILMVLDILEGRYSMQTITEPKVRALISGGLHGNSEA